MGRTLKRKGNKRWRRSKSSICLRIRLLGRKAKSRRVLRNAREPGTEENLGASDEQSSQDTKIVDGVSNRSKNADCSKVW
jgi:hypothetical protein